jgi:hypothetical protein
MRALALLGIVEQPPLEQLRVGVVLNDPFKDLALDRKSDGVGCLIALAFFSAPFGTLERGEQGSANVGWAKKLR